MGHLNELVLDVAGLLHAVILGGQCRRADDHVAHPHLAAAVALAVIAGEALHHHAGELVLAVEEDVLIGDKHVVENHQCLLSAEFGVAHVDAALLHLAGIAGLAAVDHVQPLGVGGAGEGHGVIPVRLAHGDGGHEDVPVAVDGAGLVAFRAADHNAVVAAFHHVDVHIRVGLLMGCLGAVALGVGHGAVHGQIVVLHVDEEFLEVLVIACAALLVDLIGGGVHGVEGVHAHAALEAGGGLLPQQTLHFHLLHQIIGRLVKVGEAVDFPPGQAGGGGH